MALLLSAGTAVLPGTAMAQVPDSLITQVYQAVGRGLAYFNSPGRVPDPDAVLIYSYLKERFNLPKLAKADSVLAAIRADSTSQFHKFLRIAEPMTCKMDFLDADGANDVAAAGVWYDELQDPELLWQRIRDVEWNEPYQVTHALWALAMAKNCFHAQLDTALESRLVKRNLVNLESARPLWNDVAIEALAMAQYHDSSYVPPPSYVKEIIGLQNLNGSWNWVPHDASRESQHTTILALWALLQYKPLHWPETPRDMVLH
jgi:hypothetical protein